MRPNEVGPSLRLLRERKGLTQAVVAERAGVTAGMLSSYEVGKRLPSLRSLLLLLQALNLDLRHLEQAAERLRQGAAAYRRLEEEATRENLTA